MTGLRGAISASAAAGDLPVQATFLSPSQHVDGNPYGSSIDYDFTGLGDDDASRYVVFANAWAGGFASSPYGAFSSLRYGYTSGARTDNLLGGSAYFAGRNGTSLVTIFLALIPVPAGDELFVRLALQQQAQTFNMGAWKAINVTTGIVDSGHTTSVWQDTHEVELDVPAGGMMFATAFMRDGPVTVTGGEERWDGGWADSINDYGGAGADASSAVDAAIAIAFSRTGDVTKAGGIAVR